MYKVRLLWGERVVGVRMPREGGKRGKQTFKFNVLIDMKNIQEGEGNGRGRAMQDQKLFLLKI